MGIDDQTRQYNLSFLWRNDVLNKYFFSIENYGNIF